MKQINNINHEREVEPPTLVVHRRLSYQMSHSCLSEFACFNHSSCSFCETPSSGASNGGDGEWTPQLSLR